MSDYGHDLLFGSFLTPGNDRPAQVVDLAVLSEQLGLDLVTVQDHPYQPAFLDTWTFLSFVAARTSTVHLAANVTNLPLRPPAVLGRSLASLDLLSEGRVELGLGAGAFWDAIEAMGGRRLTPGESVQAVEEAVAVIRQTWDVGARGGVRVDGKFHRVGGTSPPAPLVRHPTRHAPTPSMSRPPDRSSSTSTTPCDPSSVRSKASSTRWQQARWTSRRRGRPST